MAEQQISPPQTAAADFFTVLEGLKGASGHDTTVIEQIVVGCGPGSFTGIRVAMSLAEGLSLGFNTPLCGVNLLAALAWRYKEKGPVTVAHPSIQDDVFAQAFEAGQPVTAPHLTKAETLNGKTVHWLKDFNDSTMAGLLGQYAHGSYAHGADAQNLVQPPRPLYLRPSYAEQAFPHGGPFSG